MGTAPTKSTRGPMSSARVWVDWPSLVPQMVGRVWKQQEAIWLGVIGECHVGSQATHSRTRQWRGRWAGKNQAREQTLSWGTSVWDRLRAGREGGNTIWGKRSRNLL